MSEYNSKEVAENVIKTLEFFKANLNVEYIEYLLKEAYSEGYADGKIALLQEQIAQIEVVTGK